MGFETGGGMEDPLSDDGDSAEIESNTSTDTSQNDPGQSLDMDETQPRSKPSSDETGSTPAGESVLEFGDLDVNEDYTPQEIAAVLMDEEYHSEDPAVPYAMWRSGTSTGRKRTSIELNPSVDDLLKTAMREFEDQYECEINKSDLREMALVYGLLNLDEGVFEMAEEWGLQYNG